MTQTYCITALGKYADMGFVLSEPDDHLLILEFKNAVVDRFLQDSVSIKAIRDACLRYLISHSPAGMEQAI